MSKTTSVLIRILSVALQLLYVKAYIHYLTITELGYCFYLTALSYAINALLLIPADYYQQARLASFYTGLFPLGSVAVMNRKLLLSAAALSFVLGIPTCIAGKLSPTDLFLILGLAISLYLSTSLRNFLTNRGHVLFTGWMLLMEAGLKLSSFFVFIFSGMSHVSAFVLSTIAALLIEVLGLGLFFYRNVPFTSVVTDDLSFKTMLSTSSFVSYSSVCNWLQLQGYRIVYVWLGFPEVAGLYATVSSLGTMGMNASGTVFSQMLLPKVYSSKGTYIRHYMNLAFILCVGVLLGYIVLGRMLLVVLAKRMFAPYASLMLFGILVEAGNLIIGAAAAYLTIRHTSSHLLRANLFGLLVAVLGITMCLAWRPHNYYLLGAVLALSQFVICALLFHKINRCVSDEAINV